MTLVADKYRMATRLRTCVHTTATSVESGDRARDVILVFKNRIYFLETMIGQEVIEIKSRLQSHHENEP